MQSKELLNLADMIIGEINRICVTDDADELFIMKMHAENNIHRLYAMRYEDLKQRREEKQKKKLIFSERQKIVKQYKEWCLLNNALDCVESFLAYLIIMGYIDG